MFQNEILVEVLFVDLVHFGRVDEVNNLANTVDRLGVVDPYAVSHPSPYSRLRLSASQGSGRMGMCAFAKIGEPRRGVVLDQRSAGELALGQVLTSYGVIGCGGLTIQLAFAFFLLLELADLAIFFLLGFRFHLHRR